MTRGKKRRQVKVQRDKEKRDGRMEAGGDHSENDRPDTASGWQDDRGALVFDRRVATGL